MESFRNVLLVVIAVAVAAATPAVMADNFGSVHYDPKGNQLIVVMAYRGTTPDHHFSVHWSRCRKLDEPGAPAYQVLVSILDDQWNDAAKENYTRTIKIPLATLTCRPARVTLWTPPGVFRSLEIP